MSWVMVAQCKVAFHHHLSMGEMDGLIAGMLLMANMIAFPLVRLCRMYIEKEVSDVLRFAQMSDQNAIFTQVK